MKPDLRSVVTFFGCREVKDPLFRHNMFNVMWFSQGKLTKLFRANIESIDPFSYNIAINAKVYTFLEFKVHGDDNITGIVYFHWQFLNYANHFIMWPWADKLDSANSWIFKRKFDFVKLISIGHLKVTW